MCRKYGKELPGLPHPPMPGPMGQDLYETVSAAAWEEWQRLQTMLINEKQLSMQDPEARRYLLTQMKRFFAGETTDSPEGYVDPNK